jgi:hypothetical protein
MMLTSARQIGTAIENVKTTVAVVATVAIMMLFENLEYPTAIALVSAALTALWVKWRKHSLPRKYLIRTM